jgi:ornithine cyclodeaminase/alanine dehydrogenase-like protein (mu-crystallin family)
MEYLDGARVRAAISIPAAVAALRSGLAADNPVQPVRGSTSWTGGELLVMPGESASVAGVKLVTVGAGPVRVQGVYVLFDMATLAPVLIADAIELTLIRTAALSALATDLLAPETASRLAVVGTGPQAREHARAICAVRPITSITVRGRTPGRAEALAASLDAEIGLPVSASEDVSGADIVCICTTAATPVVEAAQLSPAAHVNAIGAHLPDHREVAADVVASSFVTVDDSDSARREAGDLIMAVAEGVVGDDVFSHDLARLVRGDTAPAAGGRTLFKSVGFGLADLLVAQLLV